MFDYYALPTDFPGYDEAMRKADAYERVLFLEDAFAKDVGDRPEKIDNGPDTAPSKRILKEIPEYDKVAVGVDTLELVGIDALKEACPHFSEWVEKLVRIF